MLRRILHAVLALLIPAGGLRAGLLINEFVTAAEHDWVELTLAAGEKESMEISSLFVTAYYGANEALSGDPVTIMGKDRPETPWDDRFVVVHLAMPGIPDETDLTGDTNGNGRIDLYCDNYSASLWNTEGVVAIDSDDDPSNGGIIDFVFYSNRDGTPNDTVLGYVGAARAAGQWRTSPGEELQECAVPIGGKGLDPHMSVSRRESADTGTGNDFVVSAVQTPGRPNFFLPAIPMKRLFRALRKRVTIIPGHCIFGKGEIPLFVFSPCALKMRVFSMDGALIHESPMVIQAKPGLCALQWNPLLQRRPPPTGLYLCRIEAQNPSLRLAEDRTIYIIVSRYR